MAGQVNTFKTITANVTTANTLVYTTPVGITSIILMAQVANITQNNHQISFTHVSGDSRTELLKDYFVLKNDAANMLTGKLIVEQNNSVEIQSSSNNALKLTMSVLETTNA
jgi:hypothetical protein